MEYENKKLWGKSGKGEPGWLHKRQIVKQGRSSSIGGNGIIIEIYLLLNINIQTDANTDKQTEGTYPDI